MARAFRFLTALPLLLALLCTGAAWADPPARVGRLSLIDGDVSLRAADSRRWDDAALNWPVTSGDALDTGRSSRAEIRVGSSVLRLDGATTVDVRQLDDERIRVVLERGSVALRVRSREAASAIEVETRDGLVVADEPGQYRVDYDDATTTLTNYRGGELELRAEDSDVVVTEGRTAHVVFADGRTDVRWDEPDRDDFADWTLARDARDDRLGRPRHVSPEMTGAEDLYEYGDWRDSADYGPIWYPRDVPSGWAPYRTGRWVSVDPWGWTWVDEAPWGFAPFHYGRWVLVGARWAWVPGTYVARPVYAPALVVWMGLPGVSVSLTSGAWPEVGWFPLAPREVYVPSYRHSPTYVRQINITHVTNVVNITRIVEEPRRAHYVYRDRREAVTVVPGEVLRLSRPVQRDAMRGLEREWRERHAVTPVPPIDPRLVAERNRRERASMPRDEERLRDEQIRRSERLREAVEERRRRDGEPRTPAAAAREPQERDAPRDADRARGGERRERLEDRVRHAPAGQSSPAASEPQPGRQIQQLQQERDRASRGQERAGERQDVRERLLEQQRQRADEARGRQLLESQEGERQQRRQLQLQERERQEQRQQQMQRQQREQREQQDRERQEAQAQQQRQQQRLQAQERERQEQRQQIERRQAERQQVERQQQREQQDRARQEAQQRQAQELERQELRQRQQFEQSQRERSRQEEHMQQLRQQQERGRADVERRLRAQPQEPRPQGAERAGQPGGEPQQGNRRRLPEEQRPAN